MRVTDFVPHWKELQVEALCAGDSRVEVRLRAVQPRAACPVCHRPSAAVHSSSTRMVADLPWSGARVTLLVLARRFRCRFGACPRRIFCERLPRLVAASARRTRRLAGALEAIGLAPGGRAGARLAARLRVPTSRMTLPRLVRALPDPEPTTPRVRGVDDWPSGAAGATARSSWTRSSGAPSRCCPRRPRLRPPPGCASTRAPRIISRDRGGVYADGARRGAPGATRVADRFHLLRNLGDVAERILRRHSALLERIPAPGAPSLPTAVLRPDRRASRERTQRELRERHCGSGTRRSGACGPGG